MAYNPHIKSKKLNILDKVVKKNPKYDYVEATVDTGSSLTKYMRKVEEIKTNYRYANDEIFKRMKIATFVQLLLQISEVDTVEKDVQELSSNSTRSIVHKNNNNSLSRGAQSLAYMSDRTVEAEGDRHSTLQQVIRGIGEIDVLTERHEHQQPKRVNLTQLAQDGEAPYLLLDIRDRDEYSNCHIISALNYPVAMLSRSVNNETRELLAYKNQVGKIIVIYDEDERIATRAATTLVQRGYDNLFMLSGGLKLAVRKFPEGLTTGTLPQSIVDANLKEIKAPKPRAQLAELYARHKGTADKATFDADDVDKLNTYLDLVLLPNDPTSRLSRATKLNSVSSRNSSVSNVSTLSKATSIHSQPWKPT